MRPRRLRGEAGSTTELVLAFPAFFLLIFIAIQFALWYHASHVALAAAQEGARAARVSGDQAAGETRTNYFLDHLSPAVITGRQVQATADTDNVRVDVWGTAESILPGFKLTIHEHSQGPVERFRGDK